MIGLSLIMIPCRAAIGRNDCQTQIKLRLSECLSGAVINLIFIKIDVEFERRCGTYIREGLSACMHACMARTARSECGTRHLQPVTASADQLCTLINESRQLNKRLEVAATCTPNSQLPVRRSGRWCWQVPFCSSFKMHRSYNFQA
jgi:hypothetical protein